MKTLLTEEGLFGEDATLGVLPVKVLLVEAILGVLSLIVGVLIVVLDVETLGEVLLREGAMGALAGAALALVLLARPPEDFLRSG